VCTEPTSSAYIIDLHPPHNQLRFWQLVGYSQLCLSRAARGDTEGGIRGPVFQRSCLEQGSTMLLRLLPKCLLPAARSATRGFESKLRGLLIWNPSGNWTCDAMVCSQSVRCT